MDPVAWRISGVDLRAARRLAGELGVSRVLAEVLVRRGIADAEVARGFLDPDFLVCDPFRLRGMDEARRRVDKALQRDELIVVHGDYDADGVTATHVLSTALRELGATVSTRLPNRFRDGYGLSVLAVEEAAAAGACLLITVDCGIRDLAAVARAREIGLDVIVTDHHEAGARLPGCLVISPRLGGYPFPHLAGAGVAFKLAHALFERPGADRIEVPLRLRPLLPAVAVGTVADVVPLIDENRVLTKMGLARLQAAAPPGLAALLEVSGAAAGPLTADMLSYRLAPRLNAAGRLDDASLALTLLGTDDWSEACRIARRLDECNTERRQIEQAMVQEAMERVTGEPPPAIVLDAPGWHEGVVGIVANRVAERTGRPTILLCSGEELAKGSGRSIAGYDLLAAVSACAEPLVGFGGHAAACGLRLRRADIPAFRERFVAHVAKTLAPGLLERRLDVDAVVCGDELTLPLAEELARLAPHGQGNPRVTLLLHGAEVESPRRSRDGRHLRCRVRADGACASAVHFDFRGADEFAGTRFDVPLELVTDDFGGCVTAQARVKALLPVVAPVDDLCPTPCDRTCALRLGGAALLDGLKRLRTGPQATAGRPADLPDVASRRVPGAVDADPADDAGRMSPQACDAAADPPSAAHVVADLRAAGRLDDGRGRPLLSSLTSLTAGSVRTLVLVADVGRRRPLLTRDLPLAALGRSAAYVQGACAAPRLAELLDDGRGPSLIMAGSETGAAWPALAAACSRLVFVDPPLSEAAFCDIVAAAPDADVHLLWGEAEVGFAGKVVESDYHMDRCLGRLWGALKAVEGDLTAALDAEVTAGPFLAKLPTLAAALRVLEDIGLLTRVGGKNPEGRVRTDPAEGVDRTTSETYRTWHRRYRRESLPSLFRTTTR